MLLKKGDGKERKPLVIIHGFFASKNSLKSFFKDEDILEQRDCYLIDLRNGEFSDWHDDHGYEVFISDIIRWADKNRIWQFDVFGHSRGAKLAQVMAIKHPYRIKNVIAADGAPRPTAS